MKGWNRAWLGAAGAALLAAAWAMHPGLERARQAFQPERETGIRDAPMLVRFVTMALGGFRGIIADFLWLRVSRLQDEGRYFEISQLSEWITRLEPGLTEVWGFHAWNMAYNISVIFPDPADRWRWVSKGIRLIRDEGLACNPDDPMLYWELGWLFQDKIGGTTDDASGYFREELVRQIEGVAGASGRVDPQTLAREPLRAEGFRRETGLDPAMMEAVDAEWGPLDWRLPESHAVYWACQGRRAARKGPMLALDRMIFQNMADTFFMGRVDGNRRVVYPEVLPNVLKAYEDALAAHGREGVESGYASFLKAAVVMLYAWDRDGDAARLFDRLREGLGGPVEASDVPSFVAERLALGAEVHHPNPASLVEGFATRALVAAARGDGHAEARFRLLADQAWTSQGRLLASVPPAQAEALRAGLWEAALRRTRDSLSEEERARLDAGVGGSARP